MRIYRNLMKIYAEEISFFCVFFGAFLILNQIFQEMKLKKKY